ncbi:helix-turn-helix domain-containing protein [Nocardia sp. NPDC060259]|uniref:helix-turn-helix domain-containing protein n=1 Tax=Nocardia sp. NPDC060259 TaxID=3347088 RepID=UPI003646E789
MDKELLAAGERIRSRMPSEMSQRTLADLAGMKPDALSRALNGQRGFSSVELARIADVLGVELYWLVTGERDPQRVRIAARHSWDVDRGVRANPGRARDEALLEQVAATYNAAFPAGPPPSRQLPESPADLRAELGEDFVESFGEVVETRLGVDVIRLPRITTSYSLTIGTRGIVMLATTSNWFWSNWSLAHELAHLALGHHGGSAEPGERDERPADDYAAQLLLPERLVEQEDWHEMDESGLARFLWRTGVSTKALKKRLAVLRIQPSTEVASALKQSTPTLIRAHATGDRMIGDRTYVTLRQQASSARELPSLLVEALQRRVEQGAISPEYLAWALDVPVDEIDFPELEDADESTAFYQQALERRPSRTALEDWLSTNGLPAQ